MKEIYLAGGCFWGLQRYYQEVSGVRETQVGYVNGKTECPTYEDVCCGGSGFAEAVRVRYDEEEISTYDILALFFHVIDPTLKNGQGNDIGEQYRTGIYYIDPADAREIEAYVNKVRRNHREPVVTEVGPLENYYRAEEYHQNYLEKNPGGYCHIGKEAFHYAGTYEPLPAAKR